jgi:tripartite ATP-independent transporter DctM subunit
MGTLAMIVVMLLLMTLGVPVSIAIGVAALAGVLVTDTPFDVMPRMMIESVDSFALLAVPFFVVAGNLLNISGITERIFNFARDVFGWMRGGLAQVTIAAEMIFSGISGAALADLAGLGVVVIKAMRDQRYPVPFAAAVMLAACVLGPIIPPSIVFVIYGLATDTSVGRLFLAGIVPGIVIGLLLMIHIAIYMRVKKPDWGQPEPFVARNAWNSFRKGAFALASPFVVIGAILAGVATPSEIGAIAAGYALIAGAAYGGLTVRGLVDCMKESVVVTAVIMYLIAVSSVMGWIVTTERIAHDAAAYIAAHVQSPLVGLLVINLLLLVVGTFLETVPALLILSPILLPVVKGLGIDPVHFGVIISYNLILGIIHPPLGIGLFVAARVARITPEQVLGATWPFFIPLFGGLLIVSAFPQLSLWLPNTVYAWLGLR